MNQRSLKIIIAEDDSVTRTLLTCFVNNLGHTCFVTKDGREASSIILNNAKHFDLIITDIQMPNMDGNALCRLLKETIHIQTPIIAATLYSRNMFKDELVACFDGWIEKPITQSKLEDEIHRLVYLPHDATQIFTKDKK